MNRLMIGMAAIIASAFIQMEPPVAPVQPNEYQLEAPVDETKSETVAYDAIDMLARCVQAEAGNQGLMGKQLVVDVILNRVDSPRFPNDVASVISQRGQFSVYPYAMNRTVVDAETIQAILNELQSRTDSQILFFTAGHYNRYCVPAYQYGAHYFGY
ncbi:MAG: cell wall hydrolase [Lachnospiraceae bacterium]|nr:cell wall hydrolase [Lachnospiraceae bacterium]